MTALPKSILFPNIIVTVVFYKLDGFYGLDVFASLTQLPNKITWSGQ